MNADRIRHFIQEDNKSIDGWFFPLDQIAFFELFSIQKQIKAQGDIAEVGVYVGKSFVMLSLLKEPNDSLIGFDLFDEDHQEQTQANLEQYGLDEEVSLIKGPTADIAQRDLDEIIPKPLRFLHIDAGHEYHEVLEQLYLFSPYLADHGIVAMDDYQDREFPGIEAAVLDFADVDRPRRFVPFLSGGNKLFLCSGAMSNSYQKMLLNRPNFTDKCRLSRVRDFNVLIMSSKLPVPSADIINQLSRLNFPKRSDDELTLNQKSSRFSQLSFGSGE